VGSSIRTAFEMRGEKPVLARLPEVSFIDDGPGSPLASTSASAAARSRVRQLRRRPPDAAVGHRRVRPAVRALRPPHRCAREWAYDRESSVGRLNKGLDEANAKGLDDRRHEAGLEVVYPKESL